MDYDRFDGMARALDAAASRRALGRALTGVGLSLVAVGLPGIAEAKRKRKTRKKTTRNKRKRQGPNLTPDLGREPASATPPPPPSPEPVLTYQCPGPKNNTVFGGSTARFAQTFTADRGGSLQQIQFSVNKFETTGDYVVQLLRVIGGTPSHELVDVLAEVTVPDAAVQLNSDASLTATFAGPVLAAGTEYAAAFIRPGSNNTAPTTRRGDGSACAGKFFGANSAGAFTPVADLDILVSVLVI